CPPEEVGPCPCGAQKGGAQAYAAFHSLSPKPQPQGQDKACKEDASVAEENPFFSALLSHFSLHPARISRPFRRRVFSRVPLPARRLNVYLCPKKKANISSGFAGPPGFF